MTHMTISSLFTFKGPSTAGFASRTRMTTTQPSGSRHASVVARPSGCIKSVSNGGLMRSNMAKVVLRYHVHSATTPTLFFIQTVVFSFNYLINGTLIFSINQYSFEWRSFCAHIGHNWSNHLQGVSIYSRWHSCWFRLLDCRDVWCRDNHASART